MKITVHIPDAIFKAADQFAQELGISRSELFARALEEYLERHDHTAITSQPNEVEDSSLEPGMNVLSLEALRNQDWSITLE